MNKALFYLIALTFPLQAHLPLKSTPLTQISDKAHHIVQSLTLEQKIGQLCMVAATASPELTVKKSNSLPYNMTPEYVEYAISQLGVGGIIFLGKSTKQSIKSHIKHFQEISAIPLLIGLDAEWGSGMRLIDGLTFPKNNRLGHYNSYYTTFAVGYCIGKELKKLGIHINFAPVVDLDTNPDNPIINNRAFSSDPQIVTKHAHAYISGLQSAGILSCIKHFPGHGDTGVDSHYDLPLLTHNRERLEHIELMPFKNLCNITDAIMVGHIAVPCLDATKTPATLSHTITTELLQKTIGFSGLIITDGLGMQAVTKQYQPGELEVAACLAGNDILLCPVDIKAAIESIKHAVTDGRLSIEQLDHKVYKIICAKLRSII